MSLAAQKVLRYLSTRSPSEVALLQLHEQTHRELESLMHLLCSTPWSASSSTAFLRRLRSDLAMHEAERPDATSGEGNVQV